MDKGIEIHADILHRALLDKNIYLGNALVALYIQCGAIAKARAIFHELPQPDVVSWNTVIAGYNRVGDGREALCFLERMRQEGFLADAVTLVCSLKACGSIKSSTKGRQIHAEIITRDRGSSLLDKNIILGTALLDMYMKCGDLRKAQQVFGQLSVHDVVCWNALIAGHAHHGHAEDALTCFHQMMQCNGIRPNAVTFLSVLKACGNIGAIDIGKRIHHDILRLGVLPNNIEVGNALMDMYAKCGALDKANEVFSQLRVRNVVSWNTLITAYVQYGHGENALQCFDQMQHEGYYPDVVTFICILKACGCIGSADMGEKIHAKIVRKGLLEKDALIGTALVDMYAKCGALAKAKEVFDQLPSQDLVSWGALIAGYAEHGHGDDALNCFDCMRQNGFSPDSLIFVSIIKACASIRILWKGKEIHSELISGDFLEKDLIGTALMDLYTKCGALAEAEWVFDKIQFRNTVMWNVLITGYVNHGLGSKSEVWFERMQCEGVCQDEVTFAGILKALGSISQIDKGKRIHAAIAGEVYLVKHNLVGNSLMDMYAKCGDLTKVQEQFEQLQVRNVESWNVLITGYKQHGYCKEVLKRFQCMQCEGLAPNTVTFICILQTCGSIGAAEKGEEIHAEIVRGSLMAKNVLVGNALLDMYAKCGSASKAQEVANQLPVQDVITWTALIAGYAHLGKDDIAIGLFNSMLGRGVEPDAIVFTVVLSACSHSGLVDMGQIYFEMMSSYYGVIPTVQHHTCMVDLFGRAGHFDKAVAVINMMPTFDYLPVWSALLAACQNQQNLELGRQAFDNAVRLDDKHAAFYVCMSNIYAVSQCTD